MRGKDASLGVFMFHDFLKIQIRFPLALPKERGAMRASLFAVAVFLCATAMAQAQTIVHFPSQTPGWAMQLDAWLYQPKGNDKHPAVVFLHGCSGLLTSKHQPVARELSWARYLNERGYVVLMIDSFGPRAVTNMCSTRQIESVYMARPYDAGAGFAYLQAQPFVDANRIAVMGWSEGGGTVLYTVGSNAVQKNPGFRVAVAFYPGSCNIARLGKEWTTSVPLLVLIGRADIWTRADWCEHALKHAQPQAQLVIYPGAYHDFDWPNNPVKRLPQYPTAAGVIPIAGENPAAHADALRRVAEFLQEKLGN